MHRSSIGLAIFHIMNAKLDGSVFVRLFIGEKGSDAAMLFFILDVAGVLICMIFYKKLKN